MCFKVIFYTCFLFSINSHSTVRGEQLNPTLSYTNECSLKRAACIHKHNYANQTAHLQGYLSKKGVRLNFLKPVCHHELYCDTQNRFISNSGDCDNLIEKLISCGVCVLSPSAGHWLMSEVQGEMTALTALICLFYRQTDTQHEFLFLLSKLATTYVCAQGTATHKSKLNDGKVLKIKPISLNRSFNL